jgi:hypothetical protein
MLVRAFRLAENLAILSLLTGSAVAMQLSTARARRRRQRDSSRLGLASLGE